MNIGTEDTLAKCCRIQMQLHILAQVFKCPMETLDAEFLFIILFGVCVYGEWPTKTMDHVTSRIR